MTTQHTHSEYNDFNEQVGEDTHASEATTGTNAHMAIPTVLSFPYTLATTHAAQSVDTAMPATIDSVDTMYTPSVTDSIGASSAQTSSDEGVTSSTPETAPMSAEGTGENVAPEHGPSIEEPVVATTGFQEEQVEAMEAGIPAVQEEVVLLSAEEIAVVQPPEAAEVVASMASVEAEHIPFEPSMAAEEESIAIASSEVIPLIDMVEEPVRPFTDFIEEFRQSEARFGSLQQESLPETFAGFAAIGNPLQAPETPKLAEVPETQVAEEEVLPPVDFGEGSAFVPTGEGVGTVNAGADMTQAAEAIGAEEESQQVATPSEQSSSVQEEIATPSTSTSPDAPVRPIERPVSPLLRPASRLRLPRHGNIRHREEPDTVSPLSSATSAAPVEPEKATQSTATEVDTSTTESTVETPKPTRRYRFDRPATQTASTMAGIPNGLTQTSPSPTRLEESKEREAKETYGRSNDGTIGAAGTVDIAGVTTPSVTTASLTSRIEHEQNSMRGAEVPTQPAVSAVSSTPVPEQEELAPLGETPIVESTTTASPVEQGRRRNGQQQQTKEAAMPTSVADITAMVSGATEAPTPPAEEVAPEDLPPLEYAELQKASSRRRRRHRSNANNNPPATVTPTASTSLPAVTPSAPAQTQANPVASDAPYSIVSGYTVSQMNKGNEGNVPFMGPEPSPARGSVSTRDGRTPRAEAQRAPVYPPARNGNDAAPSAPSMHQFANIVAQAIQTQTDRMVAELRRTNQVPTNVSVSLPAFPSTERVGVFVDVANLLYSARTLRMGVDFGKLLDFLRGNRRLVRAQAYCPTSPQAGDEQMFLQAVKGLGYRITTKNYKTFSSGAKKADLDLDLCMDVVRLVDGRAVDCVVLVSGDSDFMPMLDYCSDHGVRVEVAAFDEAMSATLRQSCDLFINLSMLEEIRL